MKNINSEGFAIKFSKLQFSPSIKKAINILMVSSIGTPMLIMFILTLPISLDLKAVLLGTNKIFIGLLIGSGVIFLLTIVLVYVGGNKRDKGQLIINKNALEFKLKKKPFTLPYSEILKIEYYLDPEEQWEWRFETISEKFTVRFKQIVERYKADNLLKEYLKEQYSELIQKE